MAEQVQTELDKYLKIIGQYDATFKKWIARTEKIIKRYRDDNRTESSSETAKFNILWSNVQTLVPAVFARLPKADVSRRFGDNDPIGRVASLLLERTLDYEIEHYSDFRGSMNHCVEDRFLGGRGVAWVRYEPHIVAQEVQITEDVEDVSDQTADQGETKEKIEYECSPTDYVHWKDFGHSPARTWEEVGQCWRWVYLTEAALKGRAESATDPDAKKRWLAVPLDSGPDPLNKYGQKERTNDRAKICELWDKEKKKVVWLSKSMKELIDEVEDPLELEDFFANPKPLYATTTSDNLEPIPDFVLYQDQANELDILSDRIDGLVKSLRVRGIYDSSQPALQRLFTEGDNNTMIPTDKWAAFSEKGGLKGSIDLVPLDTLATALLQCYQARNDIKSQVYEITGISDIIRGQTVASETATAQQLKGQYAGLRLKSMQETVSLFASELLRLKAQVICAKYQPETILKYAAADQLSDADKPLIPQALALLKANPLQSFRIEVAADSLVQIDENQNKQDRLEFLNSMSNFMREAVPAGQQVPEMVPALMSMVKYGVGGFKAARSIEGEIDQALEQLKQKAAKALVTPPSPTPDQIKAQSDAQLAQAQAQADAGLEQIKGQTAVAVANAKAQSEGQLALVAQKHEAALQILEQQHEAQMKEQEAARNDALERWKAELSAATTIQVALISAKSKETAEGDAAEKAASKTALTDLGGKLDDLSSAHKDMINTIADGHKTLLKAVSTPKRVIRGQDGRISGVEPAETIQ